MPNERGPYAALTPNELMEFLKNQRPDVSDRSWYSADLMTVLPWLLPAYYAYRKQRTDDLSGEKK